MQFRWKRDLAFLWFLALLWLTLLLSFLWFVALFLVLVFSFTGFTLAFVAFSFTFAWFTGFVFTTRSECPKKFQNLILLNYLTS